MSIIKLNSNQKITLDIIEKDIYRYLYNNKYIEIKDKYNIKIDMNILKSNYNAKYESDLDSDDEDNIKNYKNNDNDDYYLYYDLSRGYFINQEGEEDELKYSKKIIKEINKFFTQKKYHRTFFYEGLRYDTKENKFIVNYGS